jgi:hypothetical protein
MKQVEGEAPGQWRRWMLNNVHSLYFQTRRWTSRQLH